MDRNSSTKPEPDTISPVKKNTRNNSLAPTNPSTSSSSRLNYLRASTGSCHDFCKYGKEQSFEQKSGNPLQGRLVSRSVDNQILMRSAVSPVRKKKSPTSQPKSASGSSESRNFDDSPGVRKENASKPFSKNSLPARSLAEKKKETSVLYPKSTTSSAAGSTLSNPRKPSKDDIPVIKSKKEVLPHRLSKSVNLPVKSISVPPRLSSSPNRLSLSSKRANGKEKEGKGRGVSVDVQKNVSGGKIPGAKKVLPRMSVEKKKPKKVDAISKSDVIDETLSAPNEETEQIESPVTGLAVADQNESGFDICVSPETSVSAATSICLSNSPALSFQEEDKMEHEPSFELPSKLNGPTLSLQEEYEMVSDSEDYYSDSDYEENPSMELEEEILEGDREAWAARMRARIPEGVESKPMKLRFRRGKIVDLQSGGDNGPRRLKFRRGKTLEESRDVNSNTRKKSASKREVEGGSGDSVDPSEKIVLRHNDLQERKDGQASLLNNVIEETASKLVEARKSKVKALVGAFETVISLHDTKSSSAGS